MLAPKGPTFNGRPTFANPMYLKKAQSEKPCLYEIPYDQSDPANRLVPDREETLTLEKESRSKLNKDLVRPYDYTKLNSLYEIFKPATQEYHEQLAHANEGSKPLVPNLATVGMEGCGGLGGVWLIWGNKEVTMQYLVLKGGDRGACKLLGDVMVMQGR
ncbi:hypothetical protein Tco_1335460 [Tanacetum coccineum]